MKDPVKRCLRLIQVSWQKMVEVSLLGKREMFSGLQRSKDTIIV